MTAVAEVAAPPRRRTFGAVFFSRLLARPTAAIAVVVVTVLVVGAVGRRWSRRTRRTQFDYDHLFGPPSWLTPSARTSSVATCSRRVLYGGRTSLQIASLATRPRDGRRDRVGLRRRLQRRLGRASC